MSFFSLVILLDALSIFWYSIPVVFEFYEYTVAKNAFFTYNIYGMYMHVYCTVLYCTVLYMYCTQYHECISGCLYCFLAKLLRGLLTFCLL